MVILKSPKREVFQKWISTVSSSIDEKSKIKAYDFAGKIREKNISMIIVLSVYIITSVQTITCLFRLFRWRRLKQRGVFCLRNL